MSKVLVMSRVLAALSRIFERLVAQKLWFVFFCNIGFLLLDVCEVYLCSYHRQ